MAFRLAHYNLLARTYACIVLIVIVCRWILLLTAGVKKYKQL